MTIKDGFKTQIYRHIAEHPNGVLEFLFNNIRKWLNPKDAFKAGYWLKGNRKNMGDKYIIFRIDTTRGPGALMLCSAIYCYSWSCRRLLKKMEL